MNTLKFRENGNRGADAILFIHGGGISGRMWSNSLQALSEFHCLAPDLPGHGESREVRPFTLAASVEGLARLIDEQVPVKQVSIVAISVGVSIAIEFANHHPSYVVKSFLSGPTPIMHPTAAKVINIVSKPMLALLGEKQRARIVAGSMGLTNDQIKEFQQDLRRISPELVANINNLVTAQGNPIPDSPDGVVFVGENEIRATKRRAQDLAWSYGKGEIYVVPGHGHAWPLENPELFQKTVHRWMHGEDLSEHFENLPA